MDAPAGRQTAAWQSDGRAGRVGELCAVVLAAGAGTRLRPLTNLRPKALCPVNNVALVDLAIERVAAAVARDAIAVNVHHGRLQMDAHLHGRVHLSFEEPEALGTAGAIGQLLPWIDGRDVLVVNADAWTPAVLTALLDGDPNRTQLLVTRDPGRGDFGEWRFAGASFLPWAFARELKPQPSGLYETLWREQHERRALDLVPLEEGTSFFDCGTPADYLAANLAASGGVSVIGAGAVVDGTVERCVVWPNSRVEAGEHLVDCIRAGTLTVDGAAT